MAEFRYKGRTAAGDPDEGTLAATSRYQALAELRARGVTVIELRALEDALSTANRKIRAESTKAKSPRRNSRRVSLSDMSVFCRQLAISVSSGVPLRDALESILEDLEKGAPLRFTLEAVVQRLHEGFAFSEAVGEHPRVFGRLFVALIKAAEESGSMPETLERLSTGMERTERLVRKIHSITAYPMFIIVAFTIVCMVMTFSVLPKFQESFTDLGSELPRFTRIVFGANEWLVHHALFIGLVVIAVLALGALYRRTPRGRLRMDGWKLRIPLIGDIVHKIAMARICRNLAIMIRGGVPITTALEIASGVAGNAVIEAAIQRVRESIVSGSDFSSGLAREAAFPRLVVRMVGVGESSGRMPDVMDRVADAYEDQVEGSVMVATSLFEPVIIVFFGAIVLVLILAIYLPVFTSGQAMK